MRLLFCLLLLNFLGHAKAEERFLKPNDVIALVGGEDMVMASELGYLETFVQGTLPNYKLKFRSLAWEGDTVFEQRRDLNYPSLEAQLDRVGATVVIAQFGQVESLEGKPKLAAFLTAYEKLLQRLSAGGKRRSVILMPNKWMRSAVGRSPNALNHVLEEFAVAIEERAQQWGAYVINAAEGWDATTLARITEESLDGMHLPRKAQAHFALGSALELTMVWPKSAIWSSSKLPKQLAGLNEGAPVDPEAGRLLEAVQTKNRLWFNYARPQNWAFLAGDRTNQPSSRDHIDRNKRWFPEELEQFVPLIEAKEKEIWELAAKLKR